jgi:site-specific DNA-methyltransferase (adenine-specific)
MGRLGVGTDANPLAYVLTGAKVDPPTLEAVKRRLTSLRRGQPRRRSGRVDEPVAMLYSPAVLQQLCWLRSELDIEDRTDRFVMGAILGLMHANYNPASPARGLSISMPNTFSMSPNYVRRYIEQHSLAAPDVDVFDMVAAKAERMALPARTASRGRAWLADARSEAALNARARLIFTSPPYLGVIKYGKYNWIRLWMLGQEAKAVDSKLTATASLAKYLSFMSEFLAAAKNNLSPEGYLCLMIGDVSGSGDQARATNLAQAVWAKAAKPAGWRRLATVNDHLPEKHKVSRIWGKAKRGRATKVDRILILAPPGSEHRLPPALPRISWGTAISWATSRREARNVDQ